MWREVSGVASFGGWISGGLWSRSRFGHSEVGKWVSDVDRVSVENRKLIPVQLDIGAYIFLWKGHVWQSCDHSLEMWMKPVERGKVV